ncbi:hypothetical protein LJK88_21695 [Paenibacillus sp. P26]|nr:hypothetical protein LJK88_21695 [Paenibacillus sp. P26]UUZ95803.1 hypothetical protein LJK87_16175 [Paenibacillus sp. P25]
MEQHKNGRTRRISSLFVATALVIGGSGCSNSNDCVDQNRDGYCDNSGGGSSGSYYRGSSGGSGKSTVGSSSGISQGSHGGIGSSGSSSS